MSTVEKTQTATMIPAGVWRVDPAHSTVGFSVKHMMIATVRGRFGTFEGTLDVGASGVARAHGSIAGSGRVPVGKKVQLELDLSTVRDTERPAA